MKRVARILASIAVLAAAGACSVAPQQAEVCTNAAVASATDPASIRSVASKCSSNAEVYARALSKLNDLPSPSVQKIALSRKATLSEAERARFEADVVFNVLEAYPPDIAFEKLDDLLRRMNATFRVESIRILGSQDGNEKDLPSFHLARKRAEFVARYFRAAGLPSDIRVELAERDAKQPDTPEGRARDRVAEITVVALRRRSSAE
jgi:outer membrane protein OmpA-like peptidoglycan-associated protein